ncbi:MAG: ribosomal L32-like protein [Dehalococcoidales bacterium]|nr:ribosomal L32-like protein [Dehalococcoidales bacterium]
MWINVAQQLKAPVGLTRDYVVSEMVDIAGSSHLVEGEVQLIRTNRGFLVRTTLHTDVDLPCSRCLTLFRYPLSINIEEEYFPTNNIITGEPLPLPDEPDCFTIDEHNILDLTEALRQYTLMAIPMKPLCSEDCAGLCPGCGGNLNQASCHCSTRVIDRMVGAK